MTANPELCKSCGLLLGSPGPWEQHQIAGGDPMPHAHSTVPVLVMARAAPWRGSGAGRWDPTAVPGKGAGPWWGVLGGAPPIPTPLWLPHTHSRAALLPVHGAAPVPWCHAGGLGISQAGSRGCPVPLLPTGAAAGLPGACSPGGPGAAKRAQAPREGAPGLQPCRGSSVSSHGTAPRAGSGRASV